MTSTWEKIGFGVVWTMAGAGATALGSSAYFTERHKVDTDEIAYLRGRLHELENKNDDLRKEAGDAKATNLAAAELATCHAQLDGLRREQNTAAIKEMHRLEDVIDSDERRLTMAFHVWSPAGESTKDTESLSDHLLKERLAAERSDLSTMRQKLACAL